MQGGRERWNGVERRGGKRLFVKEGRRKRKDEHGVGGGVSASAREDIGGEPAVQEGGQKERVRVRSEHVEESEGVTQGDSSAVQTGKAGQGGGRGEWKRRGGVLGTKVDEGEKEVKQRRARACNGSWLVEKARECGANGDFLPEKESDGRCVRVDGAGEGGARRGARRQRAQDRVNQHGVGCCY